MRISAFIPHRGTPVLPRVLARMLARVLTPGIALGLAVAASACSDGSRGGDDLRYQVPDQPEIGSGFQEKPEWEGSRHAVATAHPLASDAGWQILEAGGSALDAAIAAQLVLTLVEPQSSGIGGGAFLMHWDGDVVEAWDGRETAPAAADTSLFLGANGRPLPFSEAMASGLSVGVPGVLAMLEVAHRAHGRLPWSALFTPAIRLAEEGFRVSPRLHAMVQSDAWLREDPLARTYFFDEALDALPVGTVLRNPALAAVLRRVADEGIEAFYTGPIAEDMVARVQGHPRHAGRLALSDLAGYPQQDFVRSTLCTPWRTYEICGFPPPSSGHIAVMQMLGILDAVESRDGPVEAPLLDGGIPSPDWLHRYLEAAKLAFADRNRYVADPAFVTPPGGSWTALLDPAYLAARATLIEPRSFGIADPGTPSPSGVGMVAFGRHPDQPESGTSHISVVDADGNAVTLTTTIESAFGSRILSDGGTGLPGGFLLNNELTDFSLAPRDADGQLIANRVEPGKRPRSSMTPTFVFDLETGDFVATLGSPGGAAIIHYVAKTLVGIFEWGLSPQAAISLPNFTNGNGPSTLEGLPNAEGVIESRFPEWVQAALEARGHEVRIAELTSGLQGIVLAPQTPTGGPQRRLLGGADPRREGVVAGR
jgi:gamma-glutamyltranspeptidase / glutathione hydrolase